MSQDDRQIAARYVKALFDLATEAGEHDQVKADMQTLKSVIEGSSELEKLLGSPVISREVSGNAMEKVLAAAKACDLTKKFFALLARNRRLAVTKLAIDDYLARLAESRGELTVHVTSAQALSADDTKTLTQTISKATGKKVQIETEENPALLGGLKVRVGSRMLDNSVEGKLDRLKQLLSAA